jgi:hypothetical protein
MADCWIVSMVGGTIWRGMIHRDISRVLILPRQTLSGSVNNTAQTGCRLAIPSFVSRASHPSRLDKFACTEASHPIAPD